MYRIMIARNGYYYVQKHCQFAFTGWNKIGGFFKTRAGARAFIRDFKRYQTTSSNIIEYVN